MNEALILSLSPAADAFDAGASLARAGAFKEAKRAADGTVLFALCEGSGKNPYEVSADLAAEPPQLRCSCPSRKRPCKHSLGLLLAFVRNAHLFSEAEVPEKLAALRAKAREKNAAASDVSPAAPLKKARAPNQAALAKKREAQLEGLTLAERVLGDIVRDGLGSYDATALGALRERGRELADFHLPGMALALRRLALNLESDDAQEVKSAEAARLIARLWTMARKGRSLLEQQQQQQPESQSAQAESDAVLEELLGKIWQLQELKERGFVRQNLELLELAYSLVDDAARDERVETSWLLDLATGDVLCDVAYTPSRRVTKQVPKPAYDVLRVSEAAVYPGFLNRRVRWEESAATPAASSEDVRQRAIACALPLEEALRRYSTQAKNLLAPSSAVVLIRASNISRAKDRFVLETPEGATLPLDGTPAALAPAPILSTLELAGWPAGTGAVLVELSIRSPGAQLVGVPLALLGSSSVVRLSL